MICPVVVIFPVTSSPAPTSKLPVTSTVPESSIENLIASAFVLSLIAKRLPLTSSLKLWLSSIKVILGLVLLILKLPVYQLILPIY